MDGGQAARRVRPANAENSVADRVLQRPDGVVDRHPRDTIAKNGDDRQRPDMRRQPDTFRAEWPQPKHPLQIDEAGRREVSAPNGIPGDRPGELDRQMAHDARATLRSPRTPSDPLVENIISRT